MFSELPGHPHCHRAWNSWEIPASPPFHTNSQHRPAPSTGPVHSRAHLLLRCRMEVRGFQGPRELEAQKDGWLSCLVSDHCEHLCLCGHSWWLPLGSPAGVGGPPLLHSLGMPIIQLPGRSLQPTVVAAAVAWGQKEGKAPFPVEGNRATLFLMTFPIGTSFEWAGCGISIIPAGLECGNQILISWCGGKVGDTFHRSEGGGVDIRPVAGLQ